MKKKIRYFGYIGAIVGGVIGLYYQNLTGFIWGFILGYLIDRLMEMNK